VQHIEVTTRFDYSDLKVQPAFWEFAKLWIREPASAIPYTLPPYLSG